jgi:hypothetical protein
MVVRRAVCCVLSGLLLVALAAPAGPGRAWASAGSKGSDGSSKGSNDSSKTSGDSSDSSKGSLDNSDQKSEDSSADSSKESTDNTTDESSKSKGATTVSAALLILTVGAAAVGLVAASRATWKNDDRRAQALARFLQRNHAMLTRDLVLGEGPMLDGWGRTMGLDAAERARVERGLAGSAEQTALVRALDGPIDRRRARSFAASFVRLHLRALGAERVGAIALAANR